MAPPTDECRFCRIVSGELPSHDLYETDNTVAFLDDHPVSEGHTIVVPKRHAERFIDLKSNEVSELFRTVHTVANAVEQELETEGFNLLQSTGESAGQTVDHVHIHVIPRQEGDGFDFKFEQRGLDDAEAEALLDELGEALPDG